MSKYTERILDEVEENFSNHFTSYNERVEFLEDLIDDLNTMMGTLSRIALLMAVKAAEDEDVKQ
tara:strand:- start:280 stop:471 length:192 start_codon:yes stop_codon:yes gene_type:complete